MPNSQIFVLFIKKEDSIKFKLGGPNSWFHNYSAGMARKFCIGLETLRRSTREAMKEYR
jgi:hypothetical protein